MKPEFERRLKSCSRLPTLPGVAIQILRLFQEEEVDFDRLTRVISQDPALCAKVLRIVNSAYYGMSRKIAELDHAVALLGVDVVRTAALSFSLVGGLSTHDTLEGHLSRLWRRSLIAAVASRQLGKLRCMTNPEVLFLAGLLQDIGMLALIGIFSDSYQRLLAEAGGNHQLLAELEKDQLGEDHAAAGSWLVKQWRLPPIYEVALAGSHDPRHVPEDSEMKDMVEIVRFSGQLADIWMGEDPTDTAVCVAEDLVPTLRMGESDIHELFSGIQESLPEISEVFQIHLGDPEAIDEITEKARETLVALSLHNAQRSQALHVKAAALERQVLDLTEKTVRDPLTGLYNRDYLDQMLEAEFQRVAQSGPPLSLVLGDLDHFKQINDSYGHQAGDRVLQSVAGLISGRVRRSDIVCRYGGEEFVLLLRETSASEAKALCQEVCRLVEGFDQELAVQSVYVTISLGVATSTGASEFASPRELLQAADDALYAAKKAGRNRVMAFPASASETREPQNEE